LRTGPRPRGPTHRRIWRADLAYTVGLLVTDGHLSVDGHHITLVSADVQLLETFKNILELKNRIGIHRGGTFGRPAYRVQFGDRLFYDWLLSVGFTSRKTYTIGALAIPDAFFPDFLRGHLDGDGSIVAYVDDYNTTLSAAYVYQRLYVKLLSASGPHIDWLRGRIVTLLGVGGYLTSRRTPLSTVPIHTLCFAKKEAIALLRWIYYAPDVPCLARKRAIAEPFLTGELRQFRHPPGFKVRELSHTPVPWPGAV
jgi:hypothetical protein